MIHETLFVVVYMRSGLGNPYRIAIFDKEQDANLFSFAIKRELGITPSVIAAVVNRAPTGA